MSAVRRTKEQRENDLEIIAKLFIQKRTHEEIAAHLRANRPYRVSRHIVSYDLGEIMERWRTTALNSVQAWKMEQLARLNVLEREAWDAWERSQKDRSSKSQSVGPDGARHTNVRLDQSDGDPRFLAVVFQCIEYRCRILGLDAPRRQEITGPDGTPVGIGQIVIELPDNGRPAYSDGAAAIGNGGSR
jgi:hypothetical protein